MELMGRTVRRLGPLVAVLLTAAALGACMATPIPIPLTDQGPIDFNEPGNLDLQPDNGSPVDGGIDAPTSPADWGSDTEGGPADGGPDTESGPDAEGGPAEGGPGDGGPDAEGGPTEGGAAQ